jgi:hypothetical protein
MFGSATEASPVVGVEEHPADTGELEMSRIAGSRPAGWQARTSWLRLPEHGLCGHEIR